MAALTLTTTPGIEDLAADELRAALGVEVRATLGPDDRAGHLVVEADVDPAALASAALGLRSVHRVIRPLVTVVLADDDPLGEVRRTFAALAAATPELAPPDVTFRVTATRHGTHPFTSEDLARVAGAGVRDVLPRAVRLKGADVQLRCDLRDRTCAVGLQLNRETLSDRRPGPFRPETSLKANLAWALLQLARPEAPPIRLLDPFAGGGTILVEAAARWPDVRLAGSDLYARNADGVRENLAPVADRAEVRTGDARHLDALWPEGGFDTVVTNPPFGRRLGAGLDLEALYRSFLRSAAAVCTPDARMVVLVQRRGAFNRALRGSGWETRHVRIVELGGLYAGVFVLSRAPAGGSVARADRDV